MTQLKSIQVLRALAAFAVMLAHLQSIEASQSGAPGLLSPLLLAGFGGVDLFFVISGFIMVWVAADWAPGRQSALKFLFARVTRIYPLWWLFAAATAGYFLIATGVPWDAEMLANFDLSGTEHLLKSFLLIPHEAFPVLTLGWTLMHEMYFYLVFAALLLLPQAYRGPALIGWGVLILIAMLSGATGFYADTLFALAVYPMTLEFLFGAAAGWLIKSGRTGWAGPALALGCAGFLAALLVVDFTSLEDSLPILRTFTFGPASALIVYAVAALELEHKPLPWAHARLVQLGDWSYSLYLCHILVISAVARLFFPIFGAEGSFDNLVFLLVAGTAAITVAGAAYTLFERPLLTRARAARKRLFDTSAKPQS